MNRLHELAPQVYGERWQTPLARHLDYAPQTVGKWKRGIIPAPRTVILLLETYAAFGWEYDRDANAVKQKVQVHAAR